MDPEIFVKKSDAVILGMLSKYPKSGQVYLQHLDPKLRPVGNFFVTLKASADVKKEYGDLIRALAAWGRVVTVEDDPEKGGLIGKLQREKTVVDRMFAAH